MTEKKHTPILAEPIAGILPPEGLNCIGAYHGYGVAIGVTDKNSGEVKHQVIIVAGSVTDLRKFSTALLPGEAFNENGVAKLTVVGTDFVTMNQSEL